MNKELSSELDQRLRIHVERIVRPVRAAERRKDRMREELLAHATAAFQEERQAHDSDDDSVEAVFDRLGKSAELSRELQAGVSWIERLLFTGQRGPTRVQRWLYRKPGESIWHLTARCAVIYGLCLALAMALPVLCIALFCVETSKIWRVIEIWPLFLGIWLWSLGNAVSAEALHRVIWGAVRRFDIAAGIYLLYSLGAFLILLWVRRIANDWCFLIGLDLWGWAGVASVAPVILIVSSRLGYLEHQRFHRWTGLDLAE